LPQRFRRPKGLRRRWASAHGVAQPGQPGSAAPAGPRGHHGAAPSPPRDRHAAAPAGRWRPSAAVAATCPRGI